MIVVCSCYISIGQGRKYLVETEDTENGNRPPVARGRLPPVARGRLQQMGKNICIL